MADQNDSNADPVGKSFHSDVGPVRYRTEKASVRGDGYLSSFLSALPVGEVIFDDDGETPHQHNERKYPDLMRRIDRLDGRDA